jgi:Na+-transporting NADH:ubiquinone oxidoreductase subunit D
MSQKALPLKTYFAEPLWKNNQILVAILGICSALGVTSNLSVAITMGISVSFVTACSSLLVSLLRHKTPDSVRMITQLAVISTFVTIVDQLLKAYFFDLSKTLSVYVGLIITNCLVMGRAEGLAKSVPPLPAFLDGLAAGLGYAFVLVVVGFIRELMGFGTLFGIQVIPEWFYATAEHPDAYQNFGIMLTPPGAFFLLGGFIGVANIINRSKDHA